jgi:hypothetical protein
MTRTTVATLPDSSTLTKLYDLMALITDLGPSFHPIPSKGVVHIKVDADKVEEAKTILKQM